MPTPVKNAKSVYICLPLFFSGLRKQLADLLFIYGLVKNHILILDSLSKIRAEKGNDYTQLIQ
jgi:hypothetical protein